MFGGAGGDMMVGFVTKRDASLYMQSSTCVLRNDALA